jgi:hypothetical protein
MGVVIEEAAMTILVWILMTYAVLGVIVFSLEYTAGPVTTGLALLRALTWPRYIATGKPYGVRSQMD